MENARFLSILNRALGETRPDPLAASTPEDPAVVAAWAGFLRRCASAGVSISDPRWRKLEVREVAGRRTLVLGTAGDDAGDIETADFTLGLSLLMSMLGRPTDTEGP